MLERLKAADRLAELHAGPEVIEADFQCPLRHTAKLRARDGGAVIERARQRVGRLTPSGDDAFS